MPEPTIDAAVAVGAALIAVLLGVWVAYLRLRAEPAPKIVEVRPPAPEKPKREFIREFGFWQDPEDGLDYCAKCEVTPLHRTPPGREEDALVRRLNRRL